LQSISSARIPAVSKTASGGLPPGQRRSGPDGATTTGPV
jgi:hypothetical protein